jgi:hypothetical protein
MPLQTQLMRFSRQGGYFFNAFSDVVFTKIALPSLYRQLDSISGHGFAHRQKRDIATISASFVAT